MKRILLNAGVKLVYTEIMNNDFTQVPTGSPASDELLHELLTYLNTFSASLGLIADNMREFAPFMTLDDGTQTDIAPVDALDNAAKSLVVKCREIGSRLTSHEAGNST